MYAPTHLEVLQQGIPAWNAWRAEEPVVKPDLSGAKLEKANLSFATLVEADFTNVDLTGCRIYGISAWNLTLGGATQQDLVITNVSSGEPVIVPAF
jgi:uncharacterized protein YjbI with pentapeptide repeats